MLNIRIDKNASVQLGVAAAYYTVLPARVQHAQAQGLASAEKKIPNALKDVGRAAKYLQVKVERFGPVGTTIKIKPFPRNQTGRNGRNIQIGSAILLTGKKGGGTIEAANAALMKTRPESVAQGYKRFYVEVRKVAIASKREQIKKIAKSVVLAELKKSFAKQGFGVRGGVTAPATDMIR